MENKFKESGSVLDHCWKCKGKLYEYEEEGSLCGDCINNMIQDSKKDFKAEYETYNN